MKKKNLLLGLIGILVLSFILIKVFLPRFTNDASAMPEPISSSGTSTQATASQNDTTPSESNVAHSVKMELMSLEMYISSHPNDTTHILRLALLYEDSHFPARATPLYERYLKLNPKSGIQPWLDLTNCYAELKKWNKALHTTDRTLKHFPNNPSVLYNKGAILANTGHYAEAETCWEKVLKTKDNGNVHHLALQALNKLKSELSSSN